MGDSAPDCMALWAKGAPTAAGDPYHPLACHLLDVAAVAAALWRGVVPEATRRWFGDQLGLDAGAAGSWAVFLAATHDVGKCSPGFQDRMSGAPGHATISAVALAEALAAPPWALDRGLARRFAVVVGAHHGIAPRRDDILKARRTRSAFGGDRWAVARDGLIRRCAAFGGVEPGAGPRVLTGAGALWLAGFVSVADWIGSNEDLFPFAALWGELFGEAEVTAYAAGADARAADALAALGWLPRPRFAEARPFAALFPFAPNPLQRAVVAAADACAEPALVLVEAPMGDGKTEAAWYVADRAAATLGQDGAYVALPTMATSNQMFARVVEFLAARHPGQPVNALLLHGHAALAADFQALRERGRRYLADLAIPDDADVGPTDRAGVMAASWFTSRKRGLLAPFGVGTVDQALLSVLQTRHFFVRLHGLAGKTVILDEVHAYDAYMSVLLERLIGWLAAMGTTVVLLSATLPSGRRERLVGAYLAGRGLSAPAPAEPIPAPPPGPYPALTVATAGTVSTVAVEASPRGRKTIGVRWRQDGGASADRLGPDLKAALAGGGVAAVVCNTVGAAQRLYAGLRAWFPADELMLFHARFRYHDRERIEQEVLRRFGKPGSGKRPPRCVLVATQVIEQSLDLDFDLMVSELAPIDLVLQRAGRLHRHPRARPALLHDPVLWIAGPAEVGGSPRFAQPDAWVYDEHVLLRSWLALRDRGTIVVPEDVPSLIEAVYDDRPCPDPSIPGLRTRWEETLTDLSRKRAVAEQTARDNAIPSSSEPPDAALDAWNRQLDEDDPGLHATLQALTRLGDPSVTAVVLWPEEAADIRPRDAIDPDRAEMLLRRSLQIGLRGVAPALIAADPPPSWRRSALLRHCRLLELDGDGTVTVGGRTLRLDPDLGLVAEPAKEER